MHFSAMEFGTGFLDNGVNRYILAFVVHLAPGVSHAVLTETNVVEVTIVLVLLTIALYLFEYFLNTVDNIGLAVWVASAKKVLSFVQTFIALLVVSVTDKFFDTGDTFSVLSFAGVVRPIIFIITISATAAGIMYIFPKDKPKATRQ
jgi:hypothetical protein